MKHSTALREGQSGGILRQAYTMGHCIKDSFTPQSLHSLYVFGIILFLLGSFCVCPCAFAMQFFFYSCIRVCSVCEWALKGPAKPHVMVSSAIEHNEITCSPTCVLTTPGPSTVRGDKRDPRKAHLYSGSVGISLTSLATYGTQSS